MSQILINKIVLISLGTVDSEEDLKPIPGVSNINPPPRDGKCDCCGRHISELKPFGAPGDDLPWGKFTGAYLVKRPRPLMPYCEEVDRAFLEAQKCYEKDGFKNAEGWLINKYGKEEGEWITFASQAQGTIGSSWECRDCILLNDEEYDDKKMQTQETSTNSSSHNA
jgi:hypothetical protein